SHASTDPDATVAADAAPSPDVTSPSDDVLALADAAVSADAMSPPDAHDLPDAPPFIDEDAPDAYPSWVRG
ncbi:MAG: hypothetical protein ACK5U8_06835, partial [Deltaproteobacteria bacterium]